MKRKGLCKPTIEDLVEMSGIEALHPGGFALTKRTAEITGMKPGLLVLDVSSGRGTQSIYYANEFGVEVVGLDISPVMIEAANASAMKKKRLSSSHLQAGRLAGFAIRCEHV